MNGVLLVTIDTLRADRVGTYGWRAARTPAIDALAARGWRAEHAYATAPITLPSHASLLTGMYPPRHGARHNGLRVRADVPTLAERLRARGFATGAFVAAFPLDRRFGLDRGFDVYSDTLPRDTNGRPRNERPGRVVVDDALAWLASIGASQGHAGAQTPAATRPFFLWVHLFEPHAPYEADPPESDQHGPDPPGGKPPGGKPPGGDPHGSDLRGADGREGAPPAADPRRTEPRRADPRAAGPSKAGGQGKDPRADHTGGPAATRSLSDRYDDEVARADAQVARLLHAIERRAASTLVIVTADHGEAFGEHGEIGHSVFVYDTTLRVPLVIAGAGIRVGSSADRVEQGARRDPRTRATMRPVIPRVQAARLWPHPAAITSAEVMVGGTSGGLRIDGRAIGGSRIGGSRIGGSGIAGSGTAARPIGGSPNANDPTGITAIRNGAITDGAIADGAITDGTIADGAIKDATIEDGAIEAGVIGETVSLVDVYPTILDLLGLAPPEPGVDGVSLRPLFSGGSIGSRAIYAESFAPLLDFGWSPLRALRAGADKYIAAPKAELYDVASDPGETRNLVAERPDAAKALAYRVAKISTADLPPASMAQIDRATDRPGDRRANSAGGRAGSRTVDRAGERTGEGAGERAVDREALARLRSLGYLAASSPPAGTTASSGTPVGRSPATSASPSTGTSTGTSPGTAVGTSTGTGVRASAGTSSGTAVGASAGTSAGTAVGASAGTSAGTSPGSPAARPDPKDRIALAAQIAGITSGEVRGPALRAALERIVRDDPRNGQMQMRLGFVLLESGACPLAVPHFDAAIAASVPSADPHLGLAECLGTMGRGDAARRALAAADRIEPGNPVVAANLGMAALEDGRLPDAIARLRDALALAPDLHQARFALARAYGRAGQRADAAREARVLLQRLPPGAPQRSEVERLLAAVQ